MVNTEHELRPAPDRSRTARMLPLAAAALSVTIALPMFGVENPQTRSTTARHGGEQQRTVRMASRKLSVPMVIGLPVGRNVDAIIRIQNIANRSVDVDIDLIRRGEEEPEVSLQRQLAARALLALRGSDHLPDGFIGAATITSKKPVVAIVEVGPRDGPTGTAVAYNPTHAGGSSILTQNRHGKGFRSYPQLFNFENRQVVASLFANDGNNNGLGRFDATLKPGGNWIQSFGDVFPTGASKQPLSIFNAVAPADKVGSGVLIQDTKTRDWFWNPATFPHIGGQRIILPRVPTLNNETSTLFVQNHGATAADVHVTRHTGPGESADINFFLGPNGLMIIDDFGFDGSDDSDSADILPWVEVHGTTNGLRGAEDAFLSAVVTTDQTAPVRIAGADPVHRGVESGKFHTLVPSWTEEYGANKRAVAFGATASDSSTVSFCALNVGPKAARIKVVVRDGDGNRVFSKTVDVGANETVDVPFPSRVQGENLSVDAKISKSGPVFTYLREERDTGETNYIPGIALK